MIQKFIFIFLFILGISSAEAQIPSGSIFWVRADSGVEISANKVTVWHDQSGLANDATQQDSTQRPTLLTNGINGLPCIHFDGSSYFNAPPFFPCNHDYSVSGVIRLSDTTVVNNVLSGNTHAIWFSGSCYLRVLHAVFPLVAVASEPVHPQGSCFTIIYNAALSMVRIYIDGRMSDSLWITANSDSTVYVGAFLGGYNMHGDISELFVYNRQLTPPEEAATDLYLETKYGLTQRPPPQPPDTTFTDIPVHGKFFPRNTLDSADFLIAGTLRTPGFDSMFVETDRNGIILTRHTSPLIYFDGGAPFTFPCSIHAELSEYTLRVGAVRNGVDSILATRDSLVCGDAFLVSGQSNAFVGFQVQDSLNEFCRTFGEDIDQNVGDTQWSLAKSLWPGDYNIVCAWSYQLAHCINDSLHLPVCIIDGASPGGTIEEHLPNNSNHLDMGSYYGRMLYRTEKAGLQHSIRAIFWDQGEWNTDTNYYNNFTALRAAWLEDYPSTEKIYVTQIRPNGCGDYSDQRPLKELQRHFQDLFPNLVCYASAALPLHDGCHLGDSGYRVWGSQMYKLFARDLYHGTDTIDIASPSVSSAFYTTPAHDEIELLFSPPDIELAITPDTVIFGSLRKMIDFLYLDGASGSVQSIRTEGNAMFLSVSNPSAQTLTYLPDRYYPDSSGIYEGPWIVNGRGVGAFIWYGLPISNQPPSAVKTYEVAMNDVEITPNPTSGEFSIDASQYTGPIEATLISETGVEVWHKSIPADHPNVLSFDMTQECSGCYLLRLSDGIQSHAWKFILQK